VERDVPGDQDGQGLLASLTALAATLVAVAHTRLDLLSNDLEEEREHVFSLLVLALAALFCLGVGVVLATLLIVVAFWDTHRLLVLGVLTGFFLLMSIAVWAFALHKVRTKPRLFAASLSELLKDRQQLTSRR
jgi:uncharacterized membrane protein YqjE